MRKPVLWRLALLATLEELAKQPMLIANAIAIGRAAHCGHRFHKAGRQPPKAPIAKGRVRLVIHQIGKVLAQSGHHIHGHLAQA